MNQTSQVVAQFPRRVEENILAHIQSGGSLSEKLKNLEETCAIH